MGNPLDPGYYETEELRGFGFKAVGENVLISRLAKVHRPENVELGSNIRIDDFTCLIATGLIRIGDFTHIGSHACWAPAAASRSKALAGCRTG